MVKTNKFGKILTMFLAVFMLCSVFTTTVFAEVTSSNGKKINFKDDGITIENVVTAMGGDTTSGYSEGNVEFKVSGGTKGTLVVTTKGEEYELLTLNVSAGSSPCIYVNPSAFKNAKQTDVTTAMRIFTDALSESGENKDTVQQIMKDMQDVDNSVSTIMLPLIFDTLDGDMYAAYQIAAPFLNILSIVLGVGAVCLIILLMFSTVMDLAYIGLPVWREAQSGKDSSKHPFGVSYEAMRTVNEVEKGIGGGDGEYRNAYLLYFKRRALTYIILAICIVYLICGGLSGIISFVLSLVGGITG